MDWGAGEVTKGAIIGPLVKDVRPLPQLVRAAKMQRMNDLMSRMEDAYYRLGIHASALQQLNDDPYVKRQKEDIRRCLIEYNHMRSTLDQEDQDNIEEAYNPFQKQDTEQEGTTC